MVLLIRRAPTQHNTFARNGVAVLGFRPPAKLQTAAESTEFVNRISISPRTRRRGSRHTRRHLLAIRLITALVVIIAGGCSTPTGSPLLSLPSPRNLPFIHKIDVQQGNVITQEMIAQLKRGMDKKQATFIMGSPIIMDTFNAHRWDYVYTFQPGGGSAEGRRVTLVFVDEKLDHVEGDVTPATGKLVVNTRQDVNVEVPLYVRKKLLARLREKIPFTEEVEEEYIYDVKDLRRHEDDDAPAENEGEDDQNKASAEDDNNEEDDAGNTLLVTGPSVLVPKDAPTNKKKRGFFRRILDGIGLGAEEDEEPGEYDPGDPKYKDITNPDDL